MRLDLGGTSQFMDDPGAISISIDGSKMEEDDDLAQVVVGDYNFMPFAAGSFDEIRGCCYAEDIVNPFALWHAAKQGCRLWVRGCSVTKYAADALVRLLQDVGFVIDEYIPPTYTDDMGWELEEGITFHRP